MATNELRFVKATEEHAKALAPWMRIGDRLEVEANSGRNPLEALLESMRVSTITRAALIDDEVAAIFGVSPVDALGGVASVWMLTGEIVDEIPYLFLRKSRSQVDELLQEWPILINFIDARYDRALRWVRWLGASVGAEIPFGVAGLPFHPFVLRRS